MFGPREDWDPPLTEFERELGQALQEEFERELQQAPDEGVDEADPQQERDGRERRGYGGLLEKVLKLNL